MECLLWVPWGKIENLRREKEPQNNEERVPYIDQPWEHQGIECIPGFFAYADSYHQPSQDKGQNQREY